MLNMFQAYRDDNSEVEFKFIHVFERIKTCEKWALVRASLLSGQGKRHHF
jgi:hypothetical protein